MKSDREGRRDAAAALLAAALSLLVAVLALQLWSRPLSMPLSYSTDAFYYDAVVKTTLDHGWYLHNPDLGAPFGLDNHDFPVVSNDSLQLVIVKAIGLFTDRPFLVSNLFLILTFPLNALGAFVALRWRRVARDLAVFGGAVFGVLPLSFMKGKDYLFFVSFAMVPLGCALVLTVLADEPLLVRRPGATGRVRPWLDRRTLLLALLCVAIASASVYYAMFTSVLLVTAAVAAGIVHRSRRAVASGLAAVGVIGTFVVLNQLPTLLYRQANGANPIVANRDPADTELYGLKLIQLVLPVPGHRIRPFAELTDRYRSTANFLGEPSTAIGLLAAVGLVWLLVVAARSILASGRRNLGTSEERNAAFLVVVAFLWATSGGLSAIVSYTVTPQFRAWSRMSVYIAFLGVLGALGLLERARQRLPSRRPVFVPLLGALFVLAALDQTSARYLPDRRVIEPADRSDRELVARIEGRMPAGTAILQLPYVAYPEVPPVDRLGAYDEMRPYLHSSRLRWSYGAMKGRPEDWHADLTDLPLRSLLAGAVAGGMRGLLVDRFGYPDGADDLENDLEAIMGPATFVDEAGRLAFWDLRLIEAQMLNAREPLDRQADLALRPLRLTWRPEFYQQESLGPVRWRWVGSRGVVDIENPGGSPRDVILSVTIKAGDGTTTVSLPDGSTENVVTDVPGGAVVRERVTLPPGHSSFEVESTAGPAPHGPGDKRTLVMQLVDMVVVPVELCAAATLLGAPEQEGGCLDTSRAHRA